MLLLAFLGFAAFYFSGAAALSVDSAYSLINFASAIVARKVMIASRSKPDATHPYGKGALENTYVLIRSSIIVGVIGLAFVGAVVSLIDYFVYGDTTEIHLGIAGGLWGHCRGDSAAAFVKLRSNGTDSAFWCTHR